MRCERGCGRVLCEWGCSATRRTLCGAVFTLISFFSIDLPRLKHAKRILRWPGLRPSTADGIERTLSALEKWMSSW